jgi:hypothetical protein
VGIAAVTADRESWTAYAAREGLIQADRQPAELEHGNKFHAVPISVDGVRFSSKREAARFLELRLMEKSGLIADLELQPTFPIHVMRLAYSECPIRVITVGVYRADFQYVNLESGEIVVEDVKGAATAALEAYRLRKKLVEAIHGVVITEIF